MKIFDALLKAMHFTKRNLWVILFGGFFLLPVLLIVATRFGLPGTVAGIIIAAILLAIMAVFCAFVGFFLVRSALHNMVSGIKSKSWNPVQGIITSSRVDVREGEPMGGDYGMGHSANMYRARIDYQYTVGGAYYTSNRIFGVRLTNGSAEKLVAKYPSGMPIRVYYNPEQPELSTLKIGIDWLRFSLSILFGLVFLAVVVWMLLILLKFR
jgi:hypothetical protein